jgi:hypothetical protein
MSEPIQQLEDAQTVGDLIKFTQNEIAKQLTRTADTLALYGLALTDCDVYVMDARTNGGGGGFLYDVRISVEVKQ